MKKSATKMSYERRYLHMPPGTKLIRRFIKRARGEAVEYRKDLLFMKDLAERQKRFFRDSNQMADIKELRLYPYMGAA